MGKLTDPQGCGFLLRVLQRAQVMTRANKDFFS